MKPDCITYHRLSHRACRIYCISQYHCVCRVRNAVSTRSLVDASAHCSLRSFPYSAVHSAIRCSMCCITKRKILHLARSIFSKMTCMIRVSHAPFELTTNLLLPAIFAAKSESDSAAINSKIGITLSISFEIQFFNSTAASESMP